MAPEKKKARTLNFFQHVLVRTETPEGVKELLEIQCLHCNFVYQSYKEKRLTSWTFYHADQEHKDPPPSLRQAPARRKVLPMMAKRTTAEEYRKLRKQARRRRQFKGIKDKGQGASFRWM